MSVQTDGKTASKVFADFIMDMPDDVIERVKNLSPQINDAQIANELSGLRFSVIDIFLYLKFKDNLDFKKQLLESIKNDISSILESAVEKEETELFRKFLLKRRAEYAITLDDDPEKLPYICVQFAEFIGIDTRNENLKDILNEITDIYKETIIEAMNLIAENFPKETESLNEQGEADIEEEQLPSPFPRDRVMKGEIAMFLIALAGAFAIYKFFTYETLTSIILGIFTGIMLFRQVTRIHLIPVPGMIQEKGKLMVSSFVIVVLFIVSFFF